MPSKIEHLTVAHGLGRTDRKVVDVDQDTELAMNGFGMWSYLEKLIERSGLVRFQVRPGNVSQAAWVDHLTDRLLGQGKEQSLPGVK